MISIIISTYNSESTLQDTLDSLLVQTNKNFECIFIDGSSTDNTNSIINEYKIEFKRLNIPVVHISESDLGIYDAWNKGLNIATEKYVFFLNSDDWIENNAIEIFHSYLNNYSEFDCFIGLRKSIDFDGNNYKLKSNNPNFLTSYRYKMPFNFTSLIAKRSLYRELNGFNAEFRLSGDYDFISRAIKSNAKFKLIPQVIVNMRKGGATSNNKNIILGIKEDFKIFKSNNTYLLSGIFMARVVILKSYFYIRDFINANRA